MSKLLELAKTKIGCGYVWGAMGEILTPEKLQWFKDVLGASHYDFNGVSASKWLNMQVFDCSGLIQWCLSELGEITGAKVSAAYFYYNKCIPIAYSDLQEGDLVFIKGSDDINHIGIYAGNGQTVEAMGTAYGVVYGNVSRFNLFGRLREGGSADMLQRGDSGSTVAELQSKLNSLGYDLTVDGDYGSNTTEAIKNFQMGNGLSADGVAGVETMAAIDAMVSKLQTSTTVVTQTLNWEQIIEKALSSPTEWKNAIDVAVNAANADGDLGPLEIFKYLPNLIEKVYNSK